MAQPRNGPWLLVSVRGAPPGPRPLARLSGVHCVPTDVKFDAVSGDYYPIIYFNDYWNLQKDYYPINESLASLPLRVSFCPLSLWRWQLYAAQSTKSPWNFLGDELYEQSDEEQDSVKVSVGRGCRLLPSCRRPRGSGPGWGLPPGKQEMGPPALGALAFGFCCPCRAFCLLDQALCSGPASPFPDLMSLLFTVSFRAFSVSTSTACDNEAGLCCLGLGSLLVSVPCQNHQPIFSVSILPLPGRAVSGPGLWGVSWPFQGFPDMGGARSHVGHACGQGQGCTHGCPYRLLSWKPTPTCWRSPSLCPSCTVSLSSWPLRMVGV
jgi:hypothetical protein